jgi:hypothetical protein
MTLPGLPLVVRFAVLDGVCVVALLLDDALGGGWLADAMALAVVVAAVAVLLAVTMRYLSVADHPSPEEEAALEDSGAVELETGLPRRTRSDAVPRPSIPPAAHPLAR